MSEQIIGKRITLIGPVFPYRGGISHFNSLLAQAFLSNHYHLQVVSYTQQYPAWLYPGKSDRDYHQKQILPDINYLLNPLLPWTWFTTYRKITYFKPDLVIIQWWTTFWSPAYIYLASRLRSRSTNVQFIIHNVIPHEARALDILLTKTTLKQASSHVVLSDNEQQRLQKLLPNIKPKLLPHPLYRQYSEYSIEKNQAKEQLGIDPRASVILFFGIVRPYKGLHTLLEALPMILQDHPFTQLIIAGEFWDPLEPYQKSIHQNGTDHHVLIENRYIPDDEVSQYFSAADIYCAPYHQATQSGSVKLAMGFGLPIVVSDALSIDVLEAEYQGLFTVPSNDPIQLAKCIINLLDQGKQPVWKPPDYSWDDFVNGLLGE